MATRTGRAWEWRIHPVVLACLAFFVSLLVFAAVALGDDRPAPREPQPILDPDVLREATTAAKDLFPVPVGTPPQNVVEPQGSTELWKFPGTRLGGDDVEVGQNEDADLIRMACDDEGRMFVAISADLPGSGEVIHIYRSVDGGDTWPLWGTIGDTSSLTQQDNPVLHMATGSNRRLFVLYAYYLSGQDWILRVASADPADETPSWTNVTAFSEPGVDFRYGDLCTDSSNFPSYWVYAVAQGDDGDGDDIWFNRSTNMGASWQTEYAIASLGLGDRDYRTPRIDYGYNGGIHVAWYFDPEPTGWDRAVRYRRAVNYANAGLSDWEPIYYITQASSGTHEYRPWVSAADDDDEVVLGYSRLSLMSVLQNGILMASTDQGDSWPVGAGTELAPIFSGASVKLNDENRWWHVVEQGNRDGVYESPDTDPDAVGSLKLFQDESAYDGVVSGWVTCAHNPTQPGQLAWAWLVRSLDAGDPMDRFYFDATWRDSPGYPNWEPDSPIDLPYEPINAPALADLDGDPELEIVFGDAGGFVRALNPDGSSLPGWPRYAGTLDRDAPVAIADLNGDGLLTVVVGNQDGRVHAYSPDGEELPGWPVQLGTSTMFVSIGPLGPPYPNWVVAGGDNHIWLLDYAGRVRPGFPWTFSANITAPAAIGDVDDDGEVEIVSVKTDWIHVNHPDSPTPEHYRRLVGKTIRQPASIGDVDGNGDLEIAVPTFQGDVYLMDHDLTDRAPWPFTDPDGYPTSAVAMANTIGNTELDLAFAQENWKVHHLWFDMDEAYGFPFRTGSGWWILASPIIEVADAGSPDIVVGARDSRGWAWENAFYEVVGWPKSLGDQVELTAAAGDIDADGRLEVVFLGLDSMNILDVGEYDAPWDGERGRWPMFMNDARRSGCNDCGPGSPTATPVALEGPIFERPRPNPTAGFTEFAFRVISRSHVKLGVFDVRGRRVALPVDEDLDSGLWIRGWDGRDHRGAQLANGVYFARLSIVRADGKAETHHRKLVMTR